MCVLYERQSDTECYYYNCKAFKSKVKKIIILKIDGCNINDINNQKHIKKYIHTYNLVIIKRDYEVILQSIKYTYICMHILYS